MPIYEYICPRCQRVHEELVPARPAENPPCPFCRDDPKVAELVKTNPVLSRFHGWVKK